MSNQRSFRRRRPKPAGRTFTGACPSCGGSVSGSTGEPPRWTIEHENECPVINGDDLARARCNREVGRLLAAANGGGRVLNVDRFGSSVVFSTQDVAAEADR